MASEGQPTNRVFYVHDADRNLDFNYPNNYLSTTKYAWYNFLPLALLLQFKRVANLYFLLTAILQSIPQISPLNPLSAIAPLVFVLGVAMIRDGIEDFYRYKADQESNSYEVQVYQQGQFQVTEAKNIYVGDIVKVDNDQAFPCDLILISSAKKDGIAHIETAAIDGERNLKPKAAHPCTTDCFDPNRPFRFVGRVECELPNDDLKSFSGSLSFDDKKESLSGKQFLPSGALLRTTPWIIGIAVFTGDDTKLRQNSKQGQTKMSKIEKLLNKYILAVMAGQFALCLIAAVGATIWSHLHQNDHDYLPNLDYHGVVTGIINFFTYFLLLNTMIPISLIISLELVKVAQAYFMSHDLKMFSKVRDRPANVNTSSLNEELGMIQHIFTDKTGTLTSNKMDFKYASVGKISYGVDQPFQPSMISDVVFNPDQEDEVNITLKSRSGKSLEMKNQSDLVHYFMLGISLCHECTIEGVSGKLVFNGNSPDEIQLLHTADQIGYSCYKMTQESIHLDLGRPSGKKDVVYDLLTQLEFTSSRARSSVIVKDPEGRIILFCKGSDAQISSRLDSNADFFSQKLMEDVDTFATQGYRTLCYGIRYIDEDEYISWKKGYDEAANSIVDREKNIEVEAEKLEQNLTMIGVSANEDKLQDNVPATLQSLQKAGIGVWMLTGDKMQTAQNIGKTCGLIRSGMIIECCEVKRKATKEDATSFLQTDSECFKEVEARLNEIKDSFAANTSQLPCVVIDGGTLRYIIRNLDEYGDVYLEKIKEFGITEEYILSIKDLFLDISSKCRTVICCRADPLQKANVVRSMKQKYNTVTLSVGDGANDVSMIMEANIGVGIYGEEGMQAVQAADVSLGEFQFLERLILRHGRLNYLRQCEMIHYFFYKNLVFTIPQFFFLFMNAYSGQTIYDDWYLTFYNLFFTALPLLFRAIYEVDVDMPDASSEELAEAHSLTYLRGRSNEIFTYQRFFYWIFIGLIHGLIAFGVPFLALESQILTVDGYNSDLWSYSIISFSCVMFMVSVKFIMTTRVWNHFIFIAITIFSVFVYVLFIFCYDYVYMTWIYKTMSLVAKAPVFYICVMFTSFLVILLDEAIHIFRLIFYPYLSEALAAEMRKKNMEIAPFSPLLSTKEVTTKGKDN